MQISITIIVPFIVLHAEKNCIQVMDIKYWMAQNASPYQIINK